MHLETPTRWCLAVEQVSRRPRELPFAAWIMNPKGFVVAFVHGLTESRAVSAALFRLRLNCPVSVDITDEFALAYRAELARLSQLGRRTA